MTIEVLGLYEAKVNGMNVKVVRDKKMYWIGNLYIDGKMKGRVPFYYTLKRVTEMEDRNYPVYKYKDLVVGRL